MAGPTQRKPASGKQGLLCHEHSHSAWVTNDCDRAMEIFRQRYGVAEFRLIEGPMPQGGQIKVAFAWAGGQVLEIIEASGPATEFYTATLPADGSFAIRFHHLGFIVHDEAGWNQLEAEIAAGQWPVAYSTLTHDFIDAYYIEAPELGHYLEYVRPMPAGVEFYAGVPAN